MEDVARCSEHGQKQPCARCRIIRNQRIGPEKGERKISAIAAIGRNRELGKGNELLWHIPDDLKRFKDLSMGHPIILGRKTFESIVKILGGPLPGRTNIVVTRNPQMFDLRGRTSEIVTAISVEKAIEKAKSAPGSEQIIIGGGAQIYEQALPFTDKLYLTLIDDTKEADSFFPPYEHDFTKKVFEEEREWNGLKYKWMDLERA